MKRFKIKSDHLIIALLVVLMLLWQPIYSFFFPTPPKPVAPVGVAAVTNVVTAVTTQTATAPQTPAPVPAAVAIPATPELTAAPVEPDSGVPEQLVVLSNSVMSLTLSSHGGGIVSAEMAHYPTTSDRNSAPVKFNFAETPAISYRGLPGFSSKAAFDIRLDPTGRTALVTRSLPGGLVFERTLTMGDAYSVKIEDVMHNSSTTTPVALPEHALQVGPMGLLPGEVRGKADMFLGIDSLASLGGESVVYWSTKPFFGKQVTLVSLFQPASRQGGCSMTRAQLEKQLPERIAHVDDTDIDWIASKNKFFVQILAPLGGASGFELQAARWMPPTEHKDEPATWSGDATLDKVGAVLRFESRILAPGETFRRQANYYIGPRDYSLVRELGNSQDEVMEFGIWAWLCKILLMSLKFLYRLIPNYGVAIILITLIIRIIFWPVTHRGTESMKKMQALQPQLAAIREKFKDKPQKLQQEMMALYKENKVNPFLGGCLPMAIQIPVFLALYNILRSDIGLRFAGFLWVGDLSEPENLLAGMLPFGLALNILPIYMAVTMAWQQKLTPSMGDPAQQKMMMLMPVIMLLFCYNLPAGMILYWSVNQTMMIVQLYWQKRNQGSTTLPAAPAR